MSENQEKLNEQLFNVITNDKDSDEARLKKVKYLVRLGADVNTRLYGKSVLSKAIEQKAGAEVVEFLKEKGANEWVISKEEAERLGKQFWEDNKWELKSKEEIEELIKKGADMNVQGDDGWTALISASRWGNKEIVEMLVSNKADMKVQGGVYGKTALLYASFCGHKEIVEVLLQNGADVHQKDKMGKTALLWAAQYGQVKVVEVLLKNGANVHQKDDGGKTALMWASQYGYKKMVEMLIAKGGDVYQKDDDEWSALKWALESGRNGVVEILERHIKKQEESKNGEVKKSEELVNNIFKSGGR